MVCFFSACLQTSTRTVENSVFVKKNKRGILAKFANSIEFLRRVFRTMFLTDVIIISTDKDAEKTQNQRKNQRINNSRL